MERLTKRGNQGVLYKDCSDFEALKRLAEYEDLDEKGLLQEIKPGLTESLVYEVEHRLLTDLCTVFELEEKERANLAIYTEGIRDMTIAVVDAIKELT